VPGDVVAGVLLGAALGLGVPGDDKCAQLLQRLGNEGGDVPAQLGEEATEVLGVPVAGHVGLAEADQLVGADAAEELRRAVDLHGRAAGSAGTPHGAVGELDTHR
jgi:hypothetical protein